MGPEFTFTLTKKEFAEIQPIAEIVLHDLSEYWVNPLIIDRAELTLRMQDMTAFFHLAEEELGEHIEDVHAACIGQVRLAFIRTNRNTPSAQIQRFIETTFGFKTSESEELWELHGWIYSDSEKSTKLIQALRTCCLNYKASWMAVSRRDNALEKEQSKIYQFSELCNYFLDELENAIKKEIRT
ncbi:hypothetical protein ACFL2R_03330 [Patescibacteria group bacterium]